MSDAEPRRGSLLITRNFPPVIGGMERLNLHLAEALADEGPLAVVAPTGASAVLEENVVVREVPLGPLWRFGLAAAWAGVGEAIRRRPRWVVAGSGLCAPFAWLAARLSGAGVAAYVHGLDLVTPHPIYRTLWLPMIRRADCIIANSAHTAGLARSIGVRPERIHVVNPGVDVPVEGASSASAWRQRHGFGDDPLLLSVGRLTERKGLAPFIADVLPRILKARPDTRLVVIGEEPRYALQPGKPGQRKAIRDAARAAGVEHCIHLLGRTDEAELHSAYAAADLHVFPIVELPGDVEGFGMVALEAAAHGVATVAYAVGGVPDAVEEGHSGRLIVPNDTTGFADAMVEQLGVARDPARRAACREVAATRSWAAFSARLNGVLASRA